jgi:dienelactone hydrolase
MNWREYESLFPQAYKRIAAAIDYLKQEKGVEKVYLMGHSMGSRMATAYLADNPKSDVAGFIGVGIRNGGGAPLDSDTNLRMVDIPVLDVYGDGGDGKDASHAETRSDMVGENYRQVLIPGADHRFTRNEKEMIESVVAWLQQQNGQSKNLLSASSTQ